MSTSAARRLSRFVRGLLPVAALALLPGCGDDSSSPTGVAAGPVQVSGQFTKGPVSAGSVSLHAISAGGTLGAVVGGPFTTDASGAWAGELPAGTAGPFLIAATGGSYTDEASGATVNIGSAQLIGYTANGSGQVTPFTHALAAAANEQIDVGRSTPAEAWASVIGTFQNAFGFDPAATVPDLNGSNESRTYLALLGGLSELLDGNAALAGLSGAAPIDLVLAFAADLSNGVLDGLDAAGNQITVDIGRGTAVWPPLDFAGLAAFIDAVNAYAAGTPGLEGIVLGLIDLDFGTPTSGSGSGSLMLSGPGTSLLNSSSFLPAGFSANAGALAWSNDGTSGDFAQVGVGRSPLDASEAAIVTFSASNGVDSWGWGAFVIEQGQSVSGVTIDGNTVTFSNVTLPGISNTQLTLVLNGTLGE